MNKSQGKLIANIGMTLDEVRKQSSIEIGEENIELISSTVFDFELAGSPGLFFKDCHYYMLRVGVDSRLVDINIGIAPRKLKWAELVASMRKVQQHLIDDGWVPAHYKEGVTAQEALNKTLAAPPPAERFNVGYTWGKGDVALTLSAKKMDGPNFIDFIKLEPRSNWEKSANPFGHSLP